MAVEGKPAEERTEAPFKSQTIIILTNLMNSSHIRRSHFCHLGSRVVSVSELLGTES